MNSFTTNSYGKIIIIHIGKGEDLLESVCRAAAENGVKNAILVSMIGSLRTAQMHYITTTEANSTDKYLTIHKPLEIGAAQGMIINGEPHFHFCLSADGVSYVGHMEKGCIVQYLIEAVLIEYNDLELIRKADEYNISYIARK